MHSAVSKLWFVTWKGRRFGFEYSRVGINGNPYLDRYIAYVGWGTLRLHKFHRGDDDRASHTHPWWFITFPLSDYIEEVYEKGVYKTTQVVKRFRFHFRPASYEHIVVGRCRRTRGQRVDGTKPFWTFVISGVRSNAWGFYPEHNKFVYWRDWT